MKMPIMHVVHIAKTVFAIAVLVSSTVSALPIGAERWKNPCGSSSSGDWNDHPRQVSEVVKDMLVRIREGQDHSGNYQDKIAIERIQSMRTVKALDGYHLDGFSDVTRPNEEETLQNLTQTYLKTYRHVATAQVFIEQLRFDEEIYEGNAHFNEINNIEAKLYDVMCHMDEVISGTEASIEHVTRDVMQIHLRTLSDKMSRYMRDYIIVKDTKKVMDNLVEAYTWINDHHKK